MRHRLDYMESRALGDFLLEHYTVKNWNNTEAAEAATKALVPLTIRFEVTPGHINRLLREHKIQQNFPRPAYVSHEEFEKRMDAQQVFCEAFFQAFKGEYSRFTSLVIAECDRVRVPTTALREDRARTLALWPSFIKKP